MTYLGGDVTPTPLVYSGKFSTQVIWTVLVRCFMIASSLAAGVIAGRWLGSDGFGTLAVLNLTVSYAVLIGNLGLVLANTYFVAQDSRNLIPASVNSLVFSLSWGAVVALFVLGLVAAAPEVFAGIDLKLMSVAVVSIPFQLITLFGLNLLLVLGLIKRLNFLDALAQFLLVINATVALMVLKSGLTTLVILNTVSTIAVSFLVLWLVTQSLQKQKTAAERWRVDLPLLGRMMRYAARMHLQTVAGLLLFRADLLVVKYFRGASEAGVYAVASQVALLLMLVPAVISTLLFPRVAAEQDATGALACRTTRHTVAVMSILCLVAIPGMFTLPLVYGAQFAGAREQALILLPGVFLISVAGVLANHFSGTGLPIIVPVFWMASLVFDMTLNFVLVPGYGARGAAVASSVSYILLFFLITFYFRARTGNSLRTAFILKKTELQSVLDLLRTAA